MTVKLSALLFLSIVLCVVGAASTPHRRLSNDICKLVMDTAKQFNSAEKTFIFRCRPGDDCGGIGDRLGGVMGGAFYAILKERSFRMQWPGWEHVFSPGWMNWTYDPQAHGIPYLNNTGGELDTKRVRGVEGNEIYVAYPPSNEVGVVNDLNSRQITEPDKVVQIEKYKHLFFHSNRGPNAQMFHDISQKFQWGRSSDEDYSAVYRCVFEGLFRPTKEFLDSKYKGIGQEPVPFHHIVSAAEDESSVSMAFHYRVGDDTAAVDGKSEIIGDEVVTRIVTLAEKHRQPGKKMNLFFVTNSNSSAYRVVQDAAVKATFHSVYSQELTAMIHVNTNLGGDGHLVDAAVLSTMQAMRDWWIMRQSDILVCQLSGFCKSAALVAPPEQVRYEEAGLAPRAWYWVMCGGRFC
jgi:hypothetical protein